MGAARGVLRDASIARPALTYRNFFSVRRPLAVLVDSPGRVAVSAPLASPSRERHVHAPLALHDVIRDDVLRGLRAARKTLPPKLFYDDTGARLFEEICELDEYYLTRAELSILAARADEIAEIAGPRCALIEYGSGAGRKVRLLLDALGNPSAYVPVDISREQLVRVAADLTRDYPSLRVQPVCADYARSASTCPRCQPTCAVWRFSRGRRSAISIRPMRPRFFEVCARPSVTAAPSCSVSTGGRM